MHLNEATLKGRAGGPALWNSSVFLSLLLFCKITAEATPPPAGVAPFISPSGGLSIDGDLQANKPSANAGDWLLSTNAGSGGAVLNAAGMPFNPATTFHFVDP